MLVCVVCVCVCVCVILTQLVNMFNKSLIVRICQ